MEVRDLNLSRLTVIIWGPGKRAVTEWRGGASQRTDLLRAREAVQPRDGLSSSRSQSRIRPLCCAGTGTASPKNRQWEQMKTKSTLSRGLLCAEEIRSDREHH